MPGITPLPPAPSVLDPQNFSAQADAFVAALGVFVTELNAIIGATIPAGSASANTLTGSTLAANVLNSSLTSVGTIANITTATAAPGTNTTRAASTAFVTAAIAAATSFAAGTRIGFQQTAAPTGWTKEVSATYNNAALRLVTGTVGTGGATGFTSVFGSGKTTGAHTLTVAETPSHTHNIFSANAGAGADTVQVAASASGVNNNTPLTSATGGGGSHDHTLSLDLAYADFIIATKN